MSVQTQIDRLTKAKSDLKASITGKGVAVSDDALISDYPALVDSIQTGSDLKVQDSKAVSYTANGSYDVSPDSGYDGMAKVTVDVNVAGGGGNVFDASLGGKLAHSKFKTLPYNIINTSQVTDMSYFFSNNGSLTSLDLSNFDTSNAIDMRSMFYDCRALTSLDLSSFNTSNVTNMSYMFRYCGKLETLDLSNFNTDAVKNSSNAFKDCTKLTTVKVINCNDATKQKILTQLQTDITTKTWTLGEDGIIRSS